MEVRKVNIFLFSLLLQTFSNGNFFFTSHSLSHDFSCENLNFLRSAVSSRPKARKKEIFLLIFFSLKEVLVRIGAINISIRNLFWSLEIILNRGEFFHFKTQFFTAKIIFWKLGRVMRDFARTICKKNRNHFEEVKN